MKNIGKYRILTLLLALVVMASCIKDPIVDCPDGAEPTDGMPDFSDGYSLTLKVTLDRMGGENVTRADGVTNYTPEHLKELENYIDPEKFRVLFFDRMDNFLFESKSRWVKLLDGPGEGSQWLVSVPIYPYGNDEEENWEWEKIRRVLTGEDINDKESDGVTSIYEKDVYGNKRDGKGTLYKETDYAFKIAILANRSNFAWNMGINGRPVSGATSDDPIEKITPGGWKLVNGPTDWNADRSKFGEKQDVKHVTVFDLHHCQDDYIYWGKNYDNKTIDTNAAPNGYNPNYDRDTKEVKDENVYPQGVYLYKYKNIYDFITTPSDNVGTAPKLSAVSTWVNWDGGHGIGDQRNMKVHDQFFRPIIPVSKTHPIPMYGIQQFAPLEGWAKGTPFNVSDITNQNKDKDKDQKVYDYKSISLLRSVVKLELILPANPEPEFVLLYYANVYARCEPMDVWTPTDEIWDASDGAHDGNDKGTCEWYRIKEHGPVANTNDGLNTNNADDSNINYQKRMSWFYGSWLERGWKFNNTRNQNLFSYVKSLRNDKGLNNDGSENVETADPNFPRIFNSCVQRNNGVVVYGKGPVYQNDKKTLATDITGDFPVTWSRYMGDDGFYHYVAYMGERNVNDPSDLSNIGKSTSGSPTVCYWRVLFNPKQHSTDNDYGIVITDHTKDSGYAKKVTNIGEDSQTHESKISNLFGESSTGSNNGYENYVMSGRSGVENPWPLVRNHVYKIKVEKYTNNLKSSSTRGGSSGGDFSVSSAEFHSESLKID